MITVKNSKSINIKFSDYEQKGLYLLFDDSTRLVLTAGEIDRITGEFWKNPLKIPPEIREAADFKLCPICPEKKSEGLCYALHPVLPFLEVIDKYASYDKVTAFYKGDEKDLLYVSETKVTTALQYISILSLIYYCRIGRKYWRYYYGVNPLTGIRDIRDRMYLNIYWLQKGDLKAINRILSEFKNEIKITSTSQVKRMRLICKNDAFVNAFANTHIATDILSMNMEEALNTSFSDFEKV